MNKGDEGSEIRVDEAILQGAMIDKPFMFFRLGAGEVIGLASCVSLTVRWFMVDGSPPKLVALKEFRGIRLTGESGEDDGEGSDNDEVSVVRVVVGEDSADSEFWVDMLSWWRCE